MKKTWAESEPQTNNTPFLTWPAVTNLWRRGRGRALYVCVFAYTCVSPCSKYLVVCREIRQKEREYGNAERQQLMRAGVEWGGCR